MEPNVYTELLSPVNLDLCDAWSSLKSTQNPFFPSDFSEVRTIAKVHSCSYHLQLSFGSSRSILRKTHCVTIQITNCIGEYLVWHWSQNQWLNKINMIFKFLIGKLQWNTDKKKCQGTEKNQSPRNTLHWGPRYRALLYWGYESRSSI